MEGLFIKAQMGIHEMPCQQICVIWRIRSNLVCIGAWIAIAVTAVLKGINAALQIILALGAKPGMA